MDTKLRAELSATLKLHGQEVNVQPDESNV
jgi:hypothetical protein